MQNISEAPVVSLEEMKAWAEEKHRKELTELAAVAKWPHYFAYCVECIDSRSGEVFQFQTLSEAECEAIGWAYKGGDWSWQREYMDFVLGERQTITLKGRQLGVTWVWGLLALHTALFTPGSDTLVYSIKEDDAVAVINRIWDMYQSLPDHIRNVVSVLKPARGARPSTNIEFRHPDGKVSSIVGMAATKSAGHGRSAALVVFDEASRQEYARDLWKAVVPAMGDKGGRIGVISTANGMSDGKGKGNFFHELWLGAGGPDYPGLAQKFLRWDLHPERDDNWYQSISLGQAEKAEQYPNTPDEAFLLSGDPYFDVASLQFYYENLPEIEGKYRFETYRDNPSKGRLNRKGEGYSPITVYARPEPGRKYAIGADVATGHGADYSVAAVIDLVTGAPVAQLKMKAEYEEFSEQLHFLGLWYNNATVAIEKGGGYGDVVIGHMRDGHKGRKPYPFMYRHRSWDHPTRPTTVQLGFPMNQKTRAHVVSSLADWINNRTLPWMTEEWIHEARTFVHRETRPSPRAADGCNDDVIMAWGIALVLFGEMGEYEHHFRKKTSAALKARRKPKPGSALDPRY